MNPGHKQLIQIALVALLLIGCIAVLLPFTGTLLFAVVICVTTLPIRNRLLTLCGGRSNLAALLVSILLLMLLVAPMALLSGSLADGVEMAIRYFKPLMEGGLPADPPAWLVRLPIIGRDAAAYWHELIESREEMNNLLHQFVDPTRRLALSAASLLAQDAGPGLGARLLASGRVQSRQTRPHPPVKYLCCRPAFETWQCAGHELPAKPVCLWSDTAPEFQPACRTWMRAPTG